MLGGGLPAPPPPPAPIITAGLKYGTLNGAKPPGGAGGNCE